MTTAKKLINTIITRTLVELAPKKGNRFGIHEFLVVADVLSNAYTVSGVDKNGKEVWKVSLSKVFMENNKDTLEKAISKKMGSEWYRFLSSK